MNLSDLFSRDPNPRPWAEGEKIPWHEPDFSRRMLREHLSQKHDAASRRASRIKKHVDWIHTRVLAGKDSRILDLGCGPGLYCARLALLGHATVGIDFSPASIEYALEHATGQCSYTLGDIREVDYGTGFDLVMLIFGEFNVFKPEDATSILQKAHAALKPEGSILLEVLTSEAVYELGSQPATWYSAENDLFADVPHLCLMESFWDEEQSVATERYFIVDVAAGTVTRYAASTQAYEIDQFTELLTQAGFQVPQRFPSLSGKAAETSEMTVLLARK